MKVIFRYKAQKPDDGHVSWLLNQDATILSFNEHWHENNGWEVAIDALEDTSKPKERRWFFLCNAGDNLDFLGDDPDLYHIATHHSKSYASYLFETGHLSETQRLEGTIKQNRYARRKPEWEDLSRREKELRKKLQEEERRSRRAPVNAPGVVAELQGARNGTDPA